MKRADVLWVASEVQAQPRSGGHLRTARLIQALAARSRVELLTTGPASSAAELEAELGVRAVTSIQGHTGLPARALAIRRGWPLAVARGWSTAAAELVAERSGNGACVVLDFVTTGAYRPHADRVVYNLHNVEAERLCGAPAPSSLHRRLERAYEVRAMRRWEARIVADRSACFVTVSSRDAALLGVAPHVVPNGTDLPPEPPPAERAGPPIFVGPLDYAPNLEAVRWWSDSIWPLLPSGFPPLDVVGRRGTLRSTPPGLRLLGEVADLAPHLARASMSVVPLLSGGGTRLKILEAMAWRLPVVTTPKGAEGLSPDLRASLLVLDDAGSIAATVTELVSDSARRVELGDAGRTAVEPYAWSRLGPQFADVVLG